MVAVSLGFPALAQSPEEQIIDSLEAQGYAVVMRDRTWLGRIWLLVENGDLRREIVFNPATGEILRDYSVMMVAQADKDERTDGGQVTGVATGSAAAVSSESVPASVDSKTFDVSTGDVTIGNLEIGDPLLVAPAGQE
jgi:hypothetical protein